MHLHFVYLLVLLLAGAAVHIAKLSDRSVARGAELVLRYLLIGYCGLPMLAVSVWALVRPTPIAQMFGVGTPGPLLAFFGYAFLGMSLVAIITLWYGGPSWSPQPSSGRCISAERRRSTSPDSAALLQAASSRFSRVTG